ncbi:MAG: F0F1 ATP synthase subunit A, partial [Anaerolineae bacterium]
MKKRYIVYACVILLVAVQFLLPTPLPPIQLPGEAVIDGVPILGSITNTFIGTLLTFLILIGMTLALRARSRTADEIPTGFYNFFEMIVEFAYGYVEGAAGKWAKNFFPFFLTFILWIVVANWMELVPLVDSLGKFENIPEHQVHLAEQAAEKEGYHLSEAEIKAVEEQYEGTGAVKNGPWLLKAKEGDTDANYTVVSFVRAAATDLNFTLAIAIISVIMTQYYGMKAQGLKYWTKFFVWNGDKIAKDPLAIMDTGVGLLEFISEVFKIVSFAFRLLGNIFAGQILLFVMAF